MSLFKIQWTEEKIRWWQAQQVVGRNRWVLTHGVMGWGTSMFLLMTAVNLFRDTGDVPLRTQLIIGMIVWPLAGFFWGQFLWSSMERSYQKYVERRVD